MISPAPMMLSLRMPCSCMSRVYSCLGCWKSRSMRPASAACWPRHSRRGWRRLVREEARCATVLHLLAGRGSTPRRPVHWLDPPPDRRVDPTNLDGAVDYSHRETPRPLAAQAIPVIGPSVFSQSAAAPDVEERPQGDAERERLGRCASAVNRSNRSVGRSRRCIASDRCIRQVRSRGRYAPAVSALGVVALRERRRPVRFRREL